MFLLLYIGIEREELRCSDKAGSVEVVIEMDNKKRLPKKPLFLVDNTGLEPVTSAMSRQHSNRLS